MLLADRRGGEGPGIRSIRYADQWVSVVSNLRWSEVTDFDRD